MTVTTSDGFVYDTLTDFHLNNPSYDPVIEEWKKRHPDMKLSDTVSRKHLAMANEYDRQYDDIKN